MGFPGAPSRDHGADDPKLGPVTDSAAPISALDAMSAHINATAVADDALAGARDDAAEFGLPVPDAVAGGTLTALAALASARRPDGPAAVAATPAVGVVGLHLFAGMPDNGVLTCIDPEIEHQKLARDAFRRAGIGSSRHRFLPSRPLDVLGRLAPGAYDLIYADVAPAEVAAFRERAWSLLSDGGVLIFAGVLLDGTIADESRRDRDTVAAREAEQHLLEREDALVTRMPIGAGAIALIKK